MKWILLLSLWPISLLEPVPTWYSEVVVEAPRRHVVLASFYHDSLHRRLTASGTRYDRNALTVAHRTLPFGTRVRLTSEATGRSVDVVCTDRGPFIPGRTWDLSRAAARRLGMVRAGVVEVTWEVIG